MDKPEPLTPQELAVYIHDMVRELAVAAREIGLTDLADALEDAELTAENAIQSLANAAPEDAT